MNLPRIPRSLKIIAVIYAIYLGLILAIATPLLNHFAPKIYREQTGRELHVDKVIWINPFKLSLSARDVGSNNADNSSFWSADALTVNLSLASIWRRHLVLDTLELRGLSVQIEQTASDRYNFSNILDYRAKQFPAETSKEKTPAEKSNESFAIDIRKILFSASHIGYHAPYASEPMAVTLSDLSFALSDFSTVSETPTKNAESPGALPALSGKNISFALSTIDLKFLREQQPFATRLQDLKIHIPMFATTGAANNSYELNVLAANGGTAQIKGEMGDDQQNTTGTLQLRNIDLLPAWQYLSNKLAFEARHAQLDGDIHYILNWRDTLRYQLIDSQLALREVQLQSRSDTDTNAAFTTLQFEGIQIDSAQSYIEIARVALQQPVLHGWNRDTKVSLLDMIYFPSSTEQKESSPWQVRIDAIAVENGALHWRASQLDNLQLAITPFSIHAANLHWPDQAPMRVAAQATLNTNTQFTIEGELVPGDVTGKFNGSIERLPLAWGNPFLQQQMRATIANGELNSRFAITFDKAKLAPLQSDGTVEQFELQSLPEKRKIAAWKKLQWQQLALESPQQRATIKQVALTQPWVQFRINSDGGNNFQQLLIKSSATTQPLPEKSSASSTAKPWQFAIDNIHIDNATLDFRDASLASAFRTNITEFSGDIDGLNNSGKKAAKIGLKGTVDGYAPVALTGSANAFAAKPVLDVTLDMTNIDLAALTPYSGTYAGYQIDGGRLTVQLAYKLKDGRIRGTNHIIVNQMQLGKQVSGPKVMDMPLRFAIYLLTDANGVMDLGVDVAGEVDDPDFSIGSIIWKAFRNVIIKTATSPFRALANLAGAGGRDDLDRIEFAPGSDQIAANQIEKLQTLNTALQKKTALKLGISGHVSPSQDLEALRDNNLSAQLIAQGGINENDIRQQSKNWQREVVKLFKKRFPDEKSEELQVMQMNDAMRDNVELQPSALQELAAQRALAAKQSLVTDIGLAADRAFVKPVDLGADKNPGLHTTLEVE